MHAGPPIYSVSQLSREVRSLLEASFASIRVEGEISNLAQPASGHKYFTLKDETAQIRCAMFRNRARFSRCTLEEGKHVVIQTRVSLYEARGDFQCIVQSVEDAGEGQLRLKFEQLKKRLAEEGLFDATLKRPLPEMPSRVGIITSASGAAIHDIISTFRRRFPAIELLIHPVPVQGEEATARIAEAIHTANQRQECDVLIVARGGGSLEDLWSFNEERVARAIYDSDLPIVSAVGHETDFTIADMVADVRAPTPTAAAELLSPDQAVITDHVMTQTLRIRRSMERCLEQASQRVDYCVNRLPAAGGHIESSTLRYTSIARRLRESIQQRLRETRMQVELTGKRLQHPKMTIQIRTQQNQQMTRRLQESMHSYLSQQQARVQYARKTLVLRSPASTISISKQSLHSTSAMLTRAVSSQMQDRRNNLQKSAQTLHILSPLATLARGYATLHDPQDGSTITAVRKVRVGDTLSVRLHDGELGCLVEKTTQHRKNNDERPRSK